MINKWTILITTLTAILFLHQTLFTQPKYITFAEYKRQYNLHFDNVFEQKYRQAIYNDNLKKIKQHNNLKNITYLMGVNQFTYLTQQEFTEIFLGYLGVEKKIIEIDDSFIEVEELDWSNKGAVTGVKNQGSCGSCWAFSTTGSLEGMSKLSYGNLQSFSQQQLIDCSSSFGNNGCNGGNMANALKYVHMNGITTQSTYPYKAAKGTCLYNTGSFKISGFGVSSGCAALTNMLLQKPVSVAVDASNWASYKQGILNTCGNTLNHGVLLVGIRNDFWKIKNSWGPNWGESGYIRISRGNTCGICTETSYPFK